MKQLKTILTVYTNLFAVWVILFGIIAFYVPDPFVAIKPGMNWFFALTMFGIGVVLQAEDFVRIIRNPLVILIGVVSQYTIMPLGAYLICRWMGFSDAITVGLVLTGSAPGAMSSNVLSYIAKADVAYSVSLTTVSTMLCPILTPGLTLLLAGAKMDVPFTKMMIDIVWMVVVPLLAGFTLRHFFRKTIDRILFVFPAISTTFIVMVCSLVIAANRDRLPNITGGIFVAALILNAYGAIMGYSVGSIFRMKKRRRRTLAIEIGMQNAGLGVVLALQHFGEETAAPAAIFVFVCIITASVLASIWRNAPESETV